MKTGVLVLFLVAGFANSSIVDSSKSPLSKKGEWDDDDSMTLASTTTIPSKLNTSDDATTPPPSSAEDQITEEQKRPRFLSLIPAGTHNVNARSQSDQEGQDQIKYRIYFKQPTTTASSIELEQDDSTTPSSSSSSSEEDGISQGDSGSNDEQSTTEASSSRIKHIQLGKIPLTYEIIPLLSPREEKQQLLGREDTKPIGFFPPEESMMHKAKYLRNEQQELQNQHSSQEEEETTEIITGKPVLDLEELPQVPLTYMVPPMRDRGEELTWNQYPQPTTTNNLRYLELPQTTTINPLLERINDFLQKAKRHSAESETTTTTRNENESTTSSSTTTAEEDTNNTEKMETTTSAENQRENYESTEAQKDQDNVSTTDPLTPVSDTPEDSNGDLNPSSPAPIPEEPSEEIYTTSRGPTILYPRPNIPEIQDYSPESDPIIPAYPSSSSPLPPPLNSISFRPVSGMDQYFSDYSNINNNAPIAPPQQQPINPYYYNTNSDPSSILRRRMMLQSFLNSNPTTTTTTTLPPPPSRPIYISPDSYWPQKYFSNNNRGSGSMNMGMGNMANMGIGESNVGYNTNMFASDYNTNANNYNDNYNTNYNYNPNPYMSPPTPTPSRVGYNNQQYNNRYDYYLRPQRQSTGYFPTSTSIPLGAVLNSILSSTSEEPSYSSSYGTPADLNDISSFRNPYYSSGSGINSDYYSYPSSTTQAPSPYALNYRQPMIPYRQSYPITSSDLVNELMMYAPLYGYEQFRRARRAQQQVGYY